MTHSIKLIALDLDGTLLDDEKHLSSANRDALEAAAKAGIYVVPATGRYYGVIPAFLRELPFLRYFITINGAAIYDAKEDRTLHRAEIAMEDAERVWDYLANLPVIYDCYQRNLGWISSEFYSLIDVYTGGGILAETTRMHRIPVEHFREEMRRRNEPVQKIQAFFRDADLPLRNQEFLRMPQVFPGLSISSANYNNIEVNALDATKGRALSVLRNFLQLPPEAVMAFGDNTNDLSMLQAAGVGVAMGNGDPSAKAAADIIAPSNNESGVAAVLRQYVLA